MGTIVHRLRGSASPVNFFVIGQEAWILWGERKLPSAIDKASCLLHINNVIHVSSQDQCDSESVTNDERWRSETFRWAELCSINSGDDANSFKFLTQFNASWCKISSFVESSTPFDSSAANNSIQFKFIISKDLFSVDFAAYKLSCLVNELQLPSRHTIRRISRLLSTYCWCVSALHASRVGLRWRCCQLIALRQVL